MAMTMQEVCNTVGNKDDFIGHTGGDNFVLISKENTAQAVHDALIERFNKDILTYYNFTDRDQGHILLEKKDGNEQYGLMKLSIGMVSPSQYHFADIREITEIAAEERKKVSLI